MKWHERVTNGIQNNPLAWLLFAAFALAEYGAYQRGVEVGSLCRVIAPADAIYSHPKTALQEAQRICANRDADVDYSN